MRTSIIRAIAVGLGLVPMALLACNSCGWEGHTSNDTVSATVMYGDQLLFDENAVLTDDELDHILDSLCTLDPKPEDLIKEVKLYQRIRRMADDEMVMLIDSLFDLAEVPYALINEINLYVSSMPTEHDVLASITVPWECNSKYPAHHVYGKWDEVRANCYTNELSAKDSVLMLKLVDPDQNCDFSLPFDGVMTSRYGWRNGRNHNGMDIDLEVWDPVLSMFPGVVRFAGHYGGFGRLVVVRHYNGLETYYAHLQRFKVEPGDIVEAGTTIGLGGSSGHSTGSHLHFEVRYKGIPIDPSHLISYSEKKLLCDTLVLKKTRWSYAAYPRGTRFHKIKKGEHLYGIAQQYGTTIQHLCELNGISRRQMLRVGQRLMISKEGENEDLGQL